MIFVICPTRTLRHVGPSANKREPFGERVNIPLHSINALDLTREPVIGDAAGFVQVVENAL